MPKANPLAAAGIAALAAFTIFITWKAKTLEGSLWGGGMIATIVHHPAPDFSLTTLDGHPVKLADYRGQKKLVVSFWASWCTPCKLELPLLKQFYEQHHRPDSRFDVVAVSIDEEMRPAKAYAAEAKLPFPVLLDSDSKVADAYQVDSIPTMILIAENGQVVWGNVGFDRGFVAELEKELGFAKPARQEVGHDNSSH